jgi:hypothetical protein
MGLRKFFGDLAAVELAYFDALGAGNRTGQDGAIVVSKKLYAGLGFDGGPVYTKKFVHSRLGINSPNLGFGKFGQNLLNLGFTEMGGDPADVRRPSGR